jgi:hypothetical protein
MRSWWWAGRKCSSWTPLFQRSATVVRGSCWGLPVGATVLYRPAGRCSQPEAYTWLRTNFHMKQRPTTGTTFPSAMRLSNIGNGDCHEYFACIFSGSLPLLGKLQEIDARTGEPRGHVVSGVTNLPRSQITAVPIYTIVSLNEQVLLSTLRITGNTVPGGPFLPWQMKGEHSQLLENNSNWNRKYFIP